MSALICGSIAFDTIMVFPDSFKKHILPDQIHVLNVSFQVPEMRREFGGCAGNIAYSLKLLGGEGLPMATVGVDFAPYAEWMQRHGIDRRYIREFNDLYTAQAFITTDIDDNQITAFHSGAMNASHKNTVPRDAGVTLGIVAPDGRDGMLQHARQFAEAGIPFIFDPGQGLPLFDGPELSAFIEQASWLAVNDYEFQVVQRRTGLKPEQIAARLDALIVTAGGQGSTIYCQGRQLKIPAVELEAAKDPTGCGDAYRAGLLYGLMRELDWETTGRIASLLGAIKASERGTQNHHFTSDEFAARFEREFGLEFP
jgi:adenosine kinase